MKKKEKMTIGIGFGVLFLGAVGIYSWQTGLLDKQQETTGTETTGTTQNVPVTQAEVLAKTTYALGENVEVNGVTINISGAEIVEDYDSLAVHYKVEQVLQDPWDRVSLYNMEFVDEEKWLVVTYTISNTGMEEKKIYPGQLQFYNRLDETTFESMLSYSGVDGRCLSGEVAPENFETDAVKLQPGETMEFEYVRQFSSYWEPVYDLYVSLNKTANVIVSMGGAFAETKVCLEIAPKLRKIDDVPVEESYDDIRDIPAMKAAQWCNLEMKEYQETGYPQTSEVVEEVVAQEYEFVGDISTKITGYKVVAWSEMPAEYQNRGALETMAKRYEEKYGVAKDSLKLLLLDVSYIATEIPSDVIDNFKWNCVFYDRSYLFTRDAEGKRWVFGTMDDWMVTSNSVNESRTGHINIEKMNEGDTIAVQAVYILPPEIYENYDALYYSGGDLMEWNEQNIPVVEIPLR